MSSKRHFVILVIIIATLINENNACFEHDSHLNMRIVSGRVFSHECSCTEPGITVENLRWLDTQGQPIGRGRPDVNTDISDDKLFLNIPQTSKSISGTYTCVVEVDGINKYAKTLTIKTYDPVKFINTPKKQHLTMGKDSKIACEVIADSRSLLFWEKEIKSDVFVNVDELKENGEKYIITDNGLVIKNVSKDDKGKYKCKVFIIDTGENEGEDINVDVQIEPTIKNLLSAPEVAIAGNPLSIECIAEGTPTPEYVWMKKLPNGMYVKETEIQQFNTIHFKRILQDDEGIYECNVCNGAGCSRKSINVQVMVPPVVTNFVNIDAKEANTVQINCNATGSPEPNITIIYKGYDVNSEGESSTHQILPNHVIKTLERSDQGIYICNATNGAGNDTSRMYLKVLHKPYFMEESNETIVWGIPGNAANLSCDNESNPPASVTWRFDSNDIPSKDLLEINKALFNDTMDEPEPFLPINIDSYTSYGTYVCIAKNEYGEAQKTITLKEGLRPPVIETEIYITNVTQNTVTFKIDGQFKEDIPEVIGYTARYDEETNYDVTDIHPNRTWPLKIPYKIDKLKPNTTYLVRFAALNEVGTGEFSPQLNFTTLEKSVPESPVFADNPGQPISNKKYRIHWKKDDDNGEPIIYYILTYCPVPDVIQDHDTKCNTIKTKTTQAEINDMDFNTTYSIELVAYNAAGASLPSHTTITTPVLQKESSSLAGGVMIAISIVVVIICLLLLDVLLLVWKRQGIIANCCLKNKKRKEDTNLNPRDIKGLLVEPRPDNDHREYEYNKTTGVVTGKHSSV